MPLVLTWEDVTLRLALAVIAGAVIGFNREERSQVVGLRTTILVCLAAALAMVLANQLLHTIGKNDAFFTQMDVLRLPLGVLSGIGFIGAGAIIRRGDVVMGVTTAATIWFMTIVGLCLGAGNYSLGISATLIALVLLWALKRVDEAISRKFHAAFTVSAQRAAFPETELRAAVERAGQQVIGWSICYEDGAERYQARLDVEWRGHHRDRAREPAYVSEVAANPAVLRAEWTPKAVSG